MAERGRRRDLGGELALRPGWRRRGLCGRAAGVEREGRDEDHREANETRHRTFLRESACTRRGHAVDAARAAPEETNREPGSRRGKGWDLPQSKASAWEYSARLLGYATEMVRLSP